MKHLRYLNKYLGVFCFISMLTIACHHHDHEGEKQLKMAGKIHDEAVAIEKEVENGLKKLKNIQKKLKNSASTSNNATLQAALDSLNTALEAVSTQYDYWKKAVVEVPGHDHDHSHGDHHDHDDDSNISPKEHLELQKELKTNIERIKMEVDKLLEATSKNMKAQ